MLSHDQIIQLIEFKEWNSIFFHSKDCIVG